MNDTQHCGHTLDNSICDQCMGTTKGPEMWVRYDVDNAGEEFIDNDGPYIHAAPVEAWAKEVKDYLEAVSCHRWVAGGVAIAAQRLLANWPVKEEK